jgi:hypothetical protein
MAGGPADTAAVKGGQPGLVPYLVLSCAFSVALGLGLVLVSIERTEPGYSVRRLEGEVKTRASHATDLEVERGRLLSPYALERKAEKLGMRAAQPGQARRMDNPAARATSR